MSEFIDAESLSLIQSTAVSASDASGKIAIIKAPELGDGKVLVVNASGDYRIFDQVRERNHTIGDIQSVIDWVKYAVESVKTADGGKSAPVVWVSPERIQIVTDDLTNKASRDSVVYNFQKTNEYKILLELANRQEPNSYQQKSFVRLLRTQLWDTLDFSQREIWIKQFRSLRSTESGSAKSAIGSSRQSLGRELDEQVNSEFGEIPDSLKLSVRLFQDPALEQRQPIVCDLECTPSTFNFTLQPIQSDLAEALENEVSDIIKLIKDGVGKDVQVFRGKP